MAAVSPLLVGRAAEIAVLNQSWARARGGSPATVLIGGEAGIGKTRLVGHFTADLGAEVLYGGCVDLSGGGLPFAPFTTAATERNRQATSRWNRQRVGAGSPEGGLMR